MSEELKFHPTLWPFCFTATFQGEEGTKVLIDRQLQVALFDILSPDGHVYLGVGTPIEADVFTREDPLIIPWCTQQGVQVLAGTRAQMHSWTFPLPSDRIFKKIRYTNGLLGVKSA